MNTGRMSTWTQADTNRFAGIRYGRWVTPDAWPRTPVPGGTPLAPRAAAPTPPVQQEAPFGQEENTDAGFGTILDAVNMTKLVFKLKFDGYSFDYPVLLTPEDEANPLEAIKGFTEWCKQNGVEPQSKAAPAPAASSRPPSGGNGQRSGGYGGGQRNSSPPRGGGYGRSDDGWECPVHGDEKLGPGYQGRGVECKVVSNQQEDWTKDVPFEGRNGDMWFCSHRSGGGR